jgi:sodium-dependent dicarboxylate transporter 2/3/5
MAVYKILHMSWKFKQGALSGKWVGLLLGPVFFFLTIAMSTPAGMSEGAQAVLACTLWIATWWISEPIPIPVTSLLPIVLFPLTGALDLQATTGAYGDPIIFLFLGGFMIAIAMERWNLHKRIALNIILLVGTDMRRIVLGFMVATAFLSMWISNTATAMMMLPIGVAIVTQLSDFEGEGTLGKSDKFGMALMLGIAYAASIGGIATLIGTPANAILAAIVKRIYQVEIAFSQWMLLALPLVILLLLACWFYMVRIAFPLQKKRSSTGKAEIQKQLQQLGKTSFEEKAVGLVFILTALAWVTRTFLLSPFFPALNDTMIAMAGVVLLFVIPSRKKKYKQGLLNWDISKKLPWGILLLFGGGLAIAAGFQDSGLTTYIGTKMTLLQGASLFIILFTIIAIINFFTEITSNTATATMMIPILASLSTAVDIHPFGPMVAASMASSCAFMLPVATPPNAVVFGSGYIQMKDMIKAGFWLNILAIILVTLYIYFMLPLIWDIDLFTLPDNFK